MTAAVATLGPNALEIDIQGKLRKEDYRQFVPMAEQRIRERGSVNLLVHALDFQGWTPSALWQDLKFDVSHYSDVDRVAIVGGDRKGEWMATVAKPFTSAAVEYFPAEKIDDARRWVQGKSQEVPGVDKTGAPAGAA